MIRAWRRRFHDRCLRLVDVAGEHVLDLDACVGDVVQTFVAFLAEATSQQPADRRGHRRRKGVPVGLAAQQQREHFGRRAAGQRAAALEETTASTLQAVEQNTEALVLRQRGRLIFSCFPVTLCSRNNIPEEQGMPS